MSIKGELFNFNTGNREDPFTSNDIEEIRSLSCNDIDKAIKIALKIGFTRGEPNLKRQPSNLYSRAKAYYAVPEKNVDYFRKNGISNTEGYLTIGTTQEAAQSIFCRNKGGEKITFAVLTINVEDLDLYPIANTGDKYKYFGSLDADRIEHVEMTTLYFG